MDADDRVQFYLDSLKRFEEGRSRHELDIITGNKSCFYYYDPEQWKVCLWTNDQRPSKVHRKKSAREKNGGSFFFMKSG